MSKWLVTSINKNGDYRTCISTFGHDLPSEKELEEQYIEQDEAIIFMQRLEDFAWLK